ncbi:MAG: hypothetical protein D6731_14035 [Planctomycetota bacterium]|nr:MAG: hypothetical protein D6731_14035 [Planctomycetota bacterium]
MGRRVGGVLCALAVGFLLFAWRSLDHAYTLRSEGIEVVGRVIERDRASGTYVVRWRWRGKDHEGRFRADDEFLRHHPRGARVSLLLLADEPEDAVPPGDSSVGGARVVFPLLLAVPCLVIGVGLLVREPGPSPAGALHVASSPAGAEETGATESPPPSASASDSDSGDDALPPFVGGRPV